MDILGFLTNLNGFISCSVKLYIFIFSKKTFIRFRSDSFLLKIEFLSKIIFLIIEKCLNLFLILFLFFLI